MYDMTHDESKEIHRAFKLGAGEYSWSFGKGMLYYFLFIEYSFLYIVWWLTGVVSNTHEFALHVIRDQSMTMLLGRLTVALMGTLTCLIIFWIGNRIYGFAVGLGAAFIGATDYIHGMYSHFIMVDLGMNLALWASFLVYLEYEKRLQLRWLLGTGALIGIAIAFKLPGAIGLPILVLAIASRLHPWHAARSFIKEAGLLALSMLVMLTLVAPEWVTIVDFFSKNFSGLFGIETTAQLSANESLDATIRTVTTHRSGHSGLRYFLVLLQKEHVVLTCAALLGVVLGLWRRHRWDLIWSVLALSCLVLLSLSDRGKPPHYLIPILPALWLLGSRAVVTVLGHRWWLAVPGFACLVAFPLAALVYQDYMWTKPDTRVVAKEWIEANVPSGAKILMDGAKYRFVMSPPLQPNDAVIERRIERAKHEGARLSRGVSSKALTLYAKAMRQLEGPAYDLHSTVWGLQVKEPRHYVDACFDYIVTSSEITKRYVRETDRQRFPNSARFYDQLAQASDFHLVYKAEPVPWMRRGPVIHVYEVGSSCS